ncbi:enoyl-CoA hydratase/isomerase family protein [Xanthobacter dioxanivorans]|uniref:Enoyl-CoA hydratase/isomerase family protein n=1 Tax=Xanthobacter dioxanivorans TaxID=2528964 RepID=A0A974SKY6_9HYPH|nr:3-hydroxyacyl-CoA dehydrogenase NAD-binding domain-containing protein [Xanthobacter dioxanivorans]QRG08992.1 enoyl-CoA hydratase/isomerase family protein [Xanthobacter dioxanivorans]
MSTLAFTTDADGIATLAIDIPDRSQNVLTPALFADLGAALDRIVADDAVIGVIITSAKPSGFIAGADLKEILALIDDGIDAVGAAAWVRTGADVFRRMETCGKPVVAALNGLALGGGFELALACHRRILVDMPGVVVGLPEVTLGLLPGGGGTQRLPRLIGIEKALPILLEGRSLAPAEALKLGVVDQLAAKDELIPAARAWLLTRPSAVAPWDVKGFKVPGGAGPLAPHAARSFQAGTARLKATRSRYPAPHAILSAVYEGTQVPFDTGLRIETKYFGLLAADPVSGNLVRSFLRQSEARKRGAFGTARAASRAVVKLGVLGAGMMGAGVANVAAGAGLEVVLLDRTLEAAERGLAHARTQREKEVARGTLSADKAEATLARIRPTAGYEDLGGADLIIEAVFENRAVKAGVTRAAEPLLAKGGVFASNTSTLSISSLAVNVADPSRFVGLHFFSPVERMSLVEVIVGKATSDQTVADALAFVSRLKKVPIVVRDSPGFYTSRVFCTYIDEAMAMLAEGVAPALMENAARMLGFPVPPLAVTDEVSLDLQKLVIDQAKADGLDARFLRAHADPVVERFNALGRLGRKSGGGFYDYAADGSKLLWPGLADLYPAAVAQPSAEDVGKRLLYIQALESARCLAEGVIDDTATADLGSVLGIGFPAWTGGALSVIATVGEDAFLRDCARFAAAHGPRFAITDGLIEQVACVAGTVRRSAA